MPRKAIGKRLRFEIFKRDDFSCRYCGRSVGPEIVLEIDHILPVSKGGNNDPLNLISSCYDCNRGKSKNLLNTKSIKHINVKKSVLLLKEQKAQLKEYLKLQREKNQLSLDLAQYVMEPIYNVLAYPEKDIPRTWFKSVNYFIKQLGIEKTRGLSDYVASMFLESQVRDPYIYFCGCCHRKIKERVNE